MTLSPENKHYVILKHTTPEGTHFDFMLENENHLSTWRIQIPPAELKTTPAKAEKIFDHPKKFLTYEGPVTGNRGSVRRWDEGTYRVLDEEDRRLALDVRGAIVSGHLALSRDAGVDHRWRVMWSRS